VYIHCPKGLHHDISPVDILFFSHINSCFYTLLPSPHPQSFNSCYHLLTQMQCISISFILYHSLFLSIFHLVLSNSWLLQTCFIYM
jgi:hypothetical protein